MKKNMGIGEIIIRVILAGVIFVLGLVYGSWWGLLGFIPLITAVVAYCPLWHALGINTRKKSGGSDIPQA